MPEKYEREIEEILRRSAFQPQRPRRKSGWPTGLTSTWQQLFADLSPAKLLAYGLILVLAGYFVGAYFPAFGVLLSLLAIVFLVGGFVLAMRRRRGHRPPMWRGRRMDEPISYRAIWQDIKRRWDTWRRRDGGAGYGRP